MTNVENQGEEILDVGGPDDLQPTFNELKGLLNIGLVFIESLLHHGDVDPDEVGIEIKISDKNTGEVQASREYTIADFIMDCNMIGVTCDLSPEDDDLEENEDWDDYPLDPDAD